MKKLLIILLLFGILVVGVQSAVDTRNYVYNTTDWIPWLSTPDGKPKVDINLVNISAKNVIVTENITANTCMCAWNGSVNYPTNKNLDDNITEILTNGTLQKTEGIWTSTNATNFYFAQVDRFTNTNWTTLFEAEIPTCGAGDFVTADGSDLACDTPAGGGGGGGDKWLDNGVWISPNASYASIVNATQFTADLQLNITKGGIKSTTGVSINASDFYDDGVLLTPDTTISNESVKVGLIIDNYIPDNITSANASIKSYIDSLDHTDLTDAEILALGYNHTTNLEAYFNTLYTLANGLFNNDNFTDLYYAIDSRYDTDNHSNELHTDVRTSITNNITSANASIKDYIDAEDTLIRTSVTTNITKVQGDITNNITGANASTIISYTALDKSTNDSIKDYVDSQVGGNTTEEIVDVINVSGQSFNITVPCSLISQDAGGDDSDFCNDANTGGGGTGVGLWVNGSSFIYINESYTQSANISNVLFVDSSSGEVGIGKSNPTEQLDVVGNITYSGQLLIPNGDLNNPSIAFQSSENTGIVYLPDDTMIFSSAGDWVFEIAQHGIYVLPNGTESQSAIGHAIDSNTGFFYPDYDSMSWTAGGVEFITLVEDTIDELVINEDGDDIDFRVETNGNPNAFFIDGDTGNIGIGLIVPNASIHTLGDIIANSFNGSWNESINYPTKTDLTNNITSANASIKSYIDSLDHTDITDSEILALGYNHTTDLETYFNTLYTSASGLFNNDNFSLQYYLISSRYDTDNHSNELHTDVRTSITENITGANASIKSYIDSLDHTDITDNEILALGYNHTTDLKVWIDANDDAGGGTGIGMWVNNSGWLRPNETYGINVNISGNLSIGSGGDEDVVIEMYDNGSAFIFDINASNVYFNVTENFTISGGLQIEGLTNCNLDTDANGYITCGTDADSGGAGNSTDDIWVAISNETWTGANASMKIYVDEIDSKLTQNISTTNASMKVYVDSFDHTDLTDAEILALGYNHTTDLETYFNTLYTLGLGLFNNDNFSSLYNAIDSRYDTDNHSNELHTDVRDSILTNITNANVSVVVLDNDVRASIITNITKVQGDITNNITSANASIKSYIDSLDHTDITDSEILALDYNHTTDLKVWVDANDEVGGGDLTGLDIVNQTMLSTAMVNNVTDIKVGAYTLTNFTANYATFGAFSNINYTNLGPYLLANFTANYFGQTDRFTNANYTALGPYLYANFTSNYAGMGPFTNTNFTALSLNHITNDSNARIGILNITMNITISNGSNSASKGGIWFNGSGICIGSC